MHLNIHLIRNIIATKLVRNDCMQFSIWGAHHARSNIYKTKIILKITFAKTIIVTQN